jgi:hypothetical protein
MIDQRKTGKSTKSRKLSFHRGVQMVVLLINTEVGSTTKTSITTKKVILTSLVSNNFTIKNEINQ